MRNRIAACARNCFLSRYNVFFHSEDNLKALAFVFLLTGSVFAQRVAPPAITYPPQLTAQLKQLQQAALCSDYAYQELAHLTNNIGPRLAGSPQSNWAAQYVAVGLRQFPLDAHPAKTTV